MRVGVTGSSGFIGSALVEALNERGDEVVRFVRPTSGEHDGHVIRWDPSTGVVDDDDLRRAGGFDAVVNLAGTGIADRRWTTARKQEILTSRIASTSLLVQAITSTDAGTPVLASGSAIGYYGSRGGEVLDESSTRGEDFLAEVCVLWEQAARPLEAQGASVSYLRTGIVMSARGGALKKQLPLFRLGLGGRLSSGRQWLSPISLLDEVRAILWIIDHKVRGPVNLVAPSPLTNAAFTKALARQLRRPALAPVPALALELVLGRELASGAVLASQRIKPTALANSGFAFDHPDASSMLHWALSANR
jgi:uncharacterized protein (TIGR01777 family)